MAEEEDEEAGGGQLPPQVTREELNLICYNLMIDVLHSQMDTQDVERHAGLGGPHAHDVLAMINKMLCTPWMAAINKCLVDTIDLEDLEEDEEAGIRDDIHSRDFTLFLEQCLQTFDLPRKGFGGLRTIFMQPYIL